MTLASGKYDAHCRKMGVRVASEGFADRAYEVDGTLVSRRKPGALITDPAKAAAQAVRMAAEGKVRTIDGVDIDLSVQTICCHGDTRAPSASCARCAGPRRGGHPRPAAREWLPRMAGARPYEVDLDCYGTLVDWEGGLATAIMRAAGPTASASSAGRHPAYMAAEREVEAGGYARIRRSWRSPRGASRAPRLAPRSRPRVVPRRERAELGRVPRHQRRARAPPRGRLRARHPVEHRRRPPDGDPAALHHDLRAHRHRAAGARLQARAPALRGRPPRDRRPAWLHVGQGLSTTWCPRGRRASERVDQPATATLPTTGGGPTGSFPPLRSWPTGCPRTVTSAAMRIFAQRRLEPSAGRAEHRAMIDIPTRLLGIG